jgi:hypothetical protein
MKRLDKCCQASARLLISPAAATVEDLRLAELKPIIPNLTAEPHDCKYYGINIKNCFEFFEHPPLGIGRKVQLSLIDLVNVGIDVFNKYDKFIAASKGCLEFAVTGAILWAENLADHEWEWLKHHGLFDTSIANWMILSNWLNDVRRYCGVGFKNKVEDQEFAAKLRRLTTLCGRDLQEADLRKEEYNMTPGRHFQVYPIYGTKNMSRKVWWNKCSMHMKRLAGEVIGQLSQRQTLRTMKEWWYTRKVWIPGGSSDMRQNLADLKAADERFRASDRPNKKTTTETVSFDMFMEKLDERPVSYARFSTKPEPGYKRRALYAQDDWSMYIASYASSEIEKYMNIGGMVAQQTPNDVVRWISADLIHRERMKATWVSLDYTDFNKEHTKTVLCALNMALSKEWCRRARLEKSPDIFLSKAWCSYWTGAAHLNAWCLSKDGCRKHWSGLWSGHRDTARDNTMLHHVYSSLVKDAVFETMNLKIKAYYEGMCGDDEDCLLDSWISIAAYLGMHAVMGWTLNPAKQMVGRTNHEFLQRQAVGDGQPLRPLAPMIATLTTGSWYKPSATYYESVIESMNSNMIEICRRNGNMQLMRRVAAVMLARIMTIPVGPELPPIKLEWWKYRFGNTPLTEFSVLWEGTEGKRAESIPDIKIPLKVHEKAPSSATQEWLELNRKWLEHMQGKVEDYRDVLMRDSYKTFYLSYMQNQKTKNALEIFGQREVGLREALAKCDGAVVKTMRPKKKEWMIICDELIKGYDARRPITEESIVGSLNMDMDLFRKIGGWRTIMKHGSQRQIGKYTVCNMVNRQRDIGLGKLQFNRMDPTLQNWLLNRYNEDD